MFRLGGQEYRVRWFGTRSACVLVPLVWHLHVIISPLLCVTWAVGSYSRDGPGG
jgi:hypothetical protein